MKKLAVIAIATLFAANVAFAQSCEEKAVGKNGKPLAGAAKTAFVKKCEGDKAAPSPAAAACAEKAVSKAGKPLAGAAKNAFMKKCEADAAPAK
jgi:hypothetical protein